MATQQVRLISVTPDAEKLISYCARVSNPKNQENENISGLLKYCLRNGHVSIFEMADLTVEITTSIAISLQAIRHKSASFQQFSQRYAEASDYIPCEARQQDLKDRQNSTDSLDFETKAWFLEQQQRVWDFSYGLYKEALSKGIAKECARFFLPVSTKTVFYMKNNVRGWIHYLATRADNKSGKTQLEHNQIAMDIKTIFIREFPIISEALEWK